ncbi:translation initiation factor IF-2 N-terminal domain-containing protein [Nocardia puris]|uniref:Uncharacterized protein DUF2744 n=1 Tax=Nocardia puris TaxID=208602 RepID=A0A366CW66_9NOCA|nr:translation initiation factor IF-2 N-terminal domain-containing protein [Nocardia puris]RBO82063.1 uncharacterized protein DUF2744 [Nocardia puris]
MQQNPPLTRQQRRARERERETKKAHENKVKSRLVGGRVDGRTFEEWEPWNGTGVPVRENCDSGNPRQALLWMFTAMPGMSGAPLMLPTEYWEMQSWRMWVLGARPAEEPTQKYQPPASVTASAWQASGKWVDLDTPDPVRKTMADHVRELPQHVRAELRRVVLEQFGVDDGDRPGPPAITYTVRTLAERLRVEVDDLLEVLANIGASGLHADSRVSREVAERIAAQMGAA